MVRAVWNGKVIAGSDETVVIEGNHYFPTDSVRHELSGLGVMSIPTLVLCDGRGNEVDRIVGLPDRRTLEQFVARASVDAK